MYFIFGRGINIAAGNCLQNYNQVVNFINNRYIERMIKRECMLMHAAGVVLKGNGIAIAGFAGRGKSTLALTLLNRGLKFLSNDRVMMKKYEGGHRIYGIPKLPRVNPGTILSNPVLGRILTEEERAEFEKYTPEKLWELEHKFDVDISDIYGPDRFVLQAEMKALVIINWDRNGDDPFAITEVGLAGRPDLVHAYMKLPGLFFEMSEDTAPPDFSETAYINCMKGCRVFEITGSVNFEEAAEHCINLLEDVKTAGVTGLNASK
jgi:HprK-related kinase B